MVTVQTDLQRPALLAVFVVESRSSHRQMKCNHSISKSKLQAQNDIYLGGLYVNLRHRVSLEI